MSSHAQDNHLHTRDFGILQNITILRNHIINHIIFSVLHINGAFIAEFVSLLQMKHAQRTINT